MIATEQLLDSLTLAQVAAFSFRVHPDGVQILTRTPSFVSALQELANQLDEPGIIAALTKHLARLPAPPTQTPSRITLRNTQDGPASRVTCVIQPPAQSHAAYLGILQHSPAQDTYYEIVEHLPDIVARFDRNLRHLYVNRAVETATPLKAADFIGKDHRELGMPDELVAQWQAVYRQVFATGCEGSKEFDYPTPQGVRHYVSRVVPEFDEQGQVRTILSIARDITQRKRLELKLEQLAHTDSLTRLLNRRCFLRRANEELERIRRYGGVLSVLLLDIDNFKTINDEFGHHTGDAALRLISEILRQETRTNDFCGRLGGDEFCIAIINAQAGQAQNIAQRICERIHAANDIRGNCVTISASIGLANWSEQDKDIFTLIERADQLMYHAKSQGKNRVVACD